ncbi:MAG TPA: UDP-N-acetylmuramoyl-tripeptide--D-alanyl-D-alanine ligase [Bacteroidota bacterium]|nr:UDP-N-acetylmuramoyl-tripeptide--D-alanyl-D-alanine ligase [Bacteroidota bacterium]
MKLTLRDLESVPGAEIVNREALAVALPRGVATDSRSARAGDLFFALRGENSDGHKFVGAAFAAGAAAAVVERGFGRSPAGGKPLIIVDDARAALGALAGIYRMKFRGPVIAVAGSNGKTTTKEMIAAVLAERYSVLSTEGNFNNDIGVPLTLFRLRRGHDVAVVEIGTNHPGEIAGLCETLMPTHGLITCIGREHLEFFGTVEGVAREEGALFGYLAGRRGGVALVNADDARVKSAAHGVKKILTYGFRSRTAAVRARALMLDDEARAKFEFRVPRVRTWQRVQLAIPGRHMASGALAAAAAGAALGVSPARIARALGSCKAQAGRMEAVTIAGVRVLNDAYNANPDSALAALDVLASLGVPGKKIAVLGDMKELGRAAAEGHEEIGERARALGVDYVLTYGELAARIHAAAGMPGAIHFEGRNALAEYLAELVAPGDAVLVKGSHTMRMDDIVTFLRERLAPGREH